MTLELGPSRKPAARRQRTGATLSIVGLDGKLLRRAGLIAIILLWPLWISGGPSYFPDSASYYRGGAAAVHFLVDRISAKKAPSTGGAAAPDMASDGPDDVRVARSITYSALAYIFAWPRGSMALLVMLHAAMVAFSIAVLLEILALRRAIYCGVIAVLALATPTAWYTGFAMPDIFAGLTILGLALLYGFDDRLSNTVKFLLLLIVGLAISAHASHIGIALVECGAVAGLTGWQMIGKKHLELRGLTWGAAATALGLALVLVTAYFGFGQISLAAKRYPFALAHAMDDPVLRKNLQGLCLTQHYEVCRMYSHGLPDSNWQFLWGTDGIAKKATAEQMERLRTEEQAVLLLLSQNNPTETSRHLAFGFLEQLYRFDLREVAYKDLVIPDPKEGIIFAESPEDGTKRPYALASAEMMHRIRIVIQRLGWLSAALSVAALLRRARPANPAWRFSILVLAGVVSNAAICATFSGVADRYQARVIWLLPLSALALINLLPPPRKKNSAQGAGSEPEAFSI